MMRVDVDPRLVRTIRKLGPEIRTKAEAALRLVSEHFGEPHRRSGLGLRKIGRRSYEARVWLEWRIVFIKESERLTAYDLMDHEQVRLWLKGRKGD
jgi:mRNA-degrading endonuclease RelE of RelBE toxin-antitoxin system